MDISVDITDGLARIAWDDGKMNAMNRVALAGLAEAMDEAEAKAEALLLVGRPGAFCAGFDMADMLGGDPDVAIKLGLGGGTLARRIFGFSGPTVAVCTGHAFTVGLLWLLASDTRVGEAGRFKLSMTEVKLGVPLEGWPLPLLAARVSPTALQAVAIQSKVYAPDEEAIRAGFLDEVVEAGQGEKRALERLEGLRALPVESYGRTKLALRKEALAAMDAGLPR